MNQAKPVADHVVRLALRWRRQLLVVLLLLLYAVLYLGPQAALARTLFVAHLGLFLIWQPFVRADRHLAWPALAVGAAAVAFIALTLNAWMLLVWVALLAGIVGGKVFLYEARWSRYFFLLALFWLVAVLVLLAMPAAVPQLIYSESNVTVVGRYLAPVVLAVMLLLPGEPEVDAQPEVIDLVYSIIVVLLLAVLLLGSLAIIVLARHNYALAMLETITAIGIALLVLGWAWNPHLGRSGIGTVFSRYLLSIGMPIERWLHELADLAERQEDPEDFVTQAVADMVERLPWVNGAAWRGAGAAGSRGSLGGNCSEFKFPQLTVAIYTHYPLSPSLTWHFNLLAQLLAEFHADKLRARELKRLTFVEAIHETGARLTHDVKNLLQSLRALCTAVQSEEAGDAPMSPEFSALLRRQLPAITDRLGQTLQKLQAPRFADEDHVAADVWWREVQKRYVGNAIEFLAIPAVPACQVSAALFDLVVENLVANALEKRKLHPALRIAVTIKCDAAGVCLEVADDGPAIARSIVRHLFSSPVPSETGMGIGLYQAARALKGSGFQLRIQENRDGEVRFQLCAVDAERPVSV